MFNSGLLAGIQDVRHMKLVEAASQIPELPELPVAAQQSLKRGVEIAQHDHNQLTCDESGSFHLYTSNENNFYRLMNKACREEDKSSLAPFMRLMKLMLDGYEKLPQQKGIGWRGLNGHNLIGEYAVGQTITWWSWSSISLNMKTAAEYLGKTGLRTLLFIQFKTAANIAAYSAYSSEEEVVLAPGTCLRVKSSAMLSEDLCIIHLAEDSPP